MKSIQKTIPWFERPDVTVSEAADILCRSSTWVRNKLVSGALELANTSETEPARVATHSIAALINRRALTQNAAMRPETASKHRRRQQRPTLRLVVDNTTG